VIFPLTTSGFWGYLVGAVALPLAWYWRSRRRRLTAHLDQLPIGLVVFDHRLRIVDLNDAAFRLSDGILRKGMQSQALPDPWNLLHPALESATIQSLELQKPLPKPDILDLQIIPLRSSGPKVPGHMVMLRDITSAKQVEAALRLANEQLHELTTHDALTGLFHRRFLMDSLEREFARAQREQAFLSIILFDIDRFKEFNDRHGHQAADHLLKQLGNLLSKRTRQQDLACRYGGEEFLLILTGASLEQAEHRAEAIRTEIATLRIPWNGESLQTTVSLGVASFPRHGQYSEDVVRAAEKAMLAAKAAGRNCTKIA